VPVAAPAAVAPQADAEPANSEAPWADEETAGDASRGSNFGPLGLVCVALILMITVYLGATMLMRQ
jgi:hypothetical protein